MNGKRLLDTNVVIPLLADDSALAGKISKAENPLKPENKLNVINTLKI